MGTLPAASLRTASSPLLLLAAFALIGSAAGGPSDRGSAEEHVIARSGPAWGYEGDHGPSHWPGVCQTGQRQSPIDIDSSKVVTSEFEALLPVNYDSSFSAEMHNNGHSLQLNMKGPHNIMLVGGGLNRVFVFEQLHFHWESEHTFGGIRFPLEAHFVHYDKALKSFDAAKGIDGGLAVLAVLFTEVSEDNPNLEFLRRMDGLAYNDEKDVTFTPEHLLPRNATSFYRYYGSLTTPGCDEVVLWTVLHNALPISKKQLQYFAHFPDANKKALQSNYRPVASVNDRIVYFQKNPAPDVAYHSASPRLTPTCFTSLLIAFTLFARKCT